MGAVAGSVRSGAVPSPRWPPVAPRLETELSTWAVIGTLGLAMGAEFAIFAAVARGPMYVSAYGSATGVVVRQLVVPSAITLAVTLAIVATLGWRRASGLVPGTATRWGTVPLGVFLFATVLTVGIPEVSSRGSAVIGLVMTGLFLAALTEEVLFRGFLLHGLTRRLGGRSAVLAGSALFAAAHVPALAQANEPPGQIAVALVVLFGFGVFLCKIRVSTGSVWFATGVHTLWNFVTIGVVGWAFSSAQDLPAAFVALKVAPLLVGLVIAVRVARGPATGEMPPMPLPERLVLPPPPRPDRP